MPVPGPDKALCGAQLPNKPQGRTCRQVAGARTNHLGVGRCWRHGGATRSHEKSAQIIQIRQAADSLGVPIEIDPGEALIRAVWEAEGNLAFYRAQVEQLSYGEEPDDAPEGGPARGILQPKMSRSSGPDAETYVVEYEPHPLVVLYHEAERWRAQVASIALKAGVEERRVRLAEADAVKVFGAQVATLVAMGLGDRLEEFRVKFVESLSAGEQPAHLGSAGTG